MFGTIQGLHDIHIIPDDIVGSPIIHVYIYIHTHYITIVRLGPAH